MVVRLVRILGGSTTKNVLIIVAFFGVLTSMNAQPDSTPSKDLGAFIFSAPIGYVNYIDDDWHDYNEQVTFGGFFTLRMPQHTYWIDAGLMISIDGSGPDSMGTGGNVFAPTNLWSGSVLTVSAGIGRAWSFTAPTTTLGIAVGAQYLYSSYMTDWFTSSYDVRHHVGIYSRIWYTINVGGAVSLGPYVSGALTTAQDRRDIMLNVSNYSVGIVLMIGSTDLLAP